LREDEGTTSRATTDFILTQRPAMTLAGKNSLEPYNGTVRIVPWPVVQ